MLRGATRIGVAVVAMVVVAEGAVWLIGSGGDPIEPVSVAPQEFFSPAEIERGEDYRGGQRALLLAGLGIQGGLLLALALGRPAPARRLLERLDSRPLAGALAAGAGLSLALTAVSLPTDLWAHERAVDVGLSVRSLDGWLADAGRSAAIGALIAGSGAAILIALIRRLPRAWPLPAGGVVVAGSVALTWLAPVVLAPIFNEFEKLPAESPARSQVLELADRAGVDIGEVYTVDASRRSTALNAYVGGVGSSRRVVLFDNLVDEAKSDELRSVVAHELAHQANDDIRRGIIFVAITAPFGLLFVRELGGSLARRGAAAPGSIAALPAYALALGVAVWVVGIPGNQLSRQIERSADTFALELTRDPGALIDLQRRLVRANVSDPDPPAWASFALGSHPPPIERIGAAIAHRDRLGAR